MRKHWISGTFLKARLYFSKFSLFFISVDSASISYTELANSRLEVLYLWESHSRSVYLRAGLPFFPLQVLYCILCERNKNKLTFKTAETEPDWGKPNCYQGPRTNNPVSGNCRITWCIANGTIQKKTKTKTQTWGCGCCWKRECHQLFRSLVLVLYEKKRCVLFHCNEGVINLKF